MIHNIQCRNCKHIFSPHEANGSVECNCGAITAIYLEDKRSIKTSNYLNIVHLDDQGNEIIFDVSHEKKADLIRSLEEMINSYEKMSSNAMMMAANQYDIQTLLLIIRSLLNI